MLILSFTLLMTFIYVCSFMRIVSLWTIMELINQSNFIKLKMKSQFSSFIPVDMIKCIAHSEDYCDKSMSPLNDKVFHIHGLRKLNIMAIMIYILHYSSTDIVFRLSGDHLKQLDRNLHTRHLLLWHVL